MFMDVLLGFVGFVVVGGYIFLFKHKHLLIVLLSLECMMLGLFGCLGLGLSMSGEEVLMMMFLVFSVCEGGVGLGLLVFFVRSYGNDYLSSISVQWC